MIRRHGSEAGYALLATLWICIGIGGLTWLISVNARDAMATSRNRIALTQATWSAQACLVRARDRVRAAFELERVRGPDPYGAVWDNVDRIIAPTLTDDGCALHARPIGARLDVNAADEQTLARLFQAAGRPAATADSAAAALSDWMDADDSARALGAERAWYEAHRRVVPSNQGFIHLDELHLVRGVEAFARLDSILDVEPGPISLNHAGPEVLSLLPGFTESTVRAMLEARARGNPVSTFHDLSALLDPRDSTASAKLPGIVVFSPSAWLVTARSRVGDPAVTTVTEIRLVRGSTTTFIARRRAWIE